MEELRVCARSILKIVTLLRFEPSSYRSWVPREYTLYTSTKCRQYTTSRHLSQSPKSRRYNLVSNTTQKSLFLCTPLLLMRYLWALKSINLLILRFYICLYFLYISVTHWECTIVHRTLRFSSLLLLNKEFPQNARPRFELGTYLTTAVIYAKPHELRHTLWASQHPKWATPHPKWATPYPRSYATPQMSYATPQWAAYTPWALKEQIRSSFGIVRTKSKKPPTYKKY